MQSPPNKIAIVGGGTAGWMAAAALSKVLPKEHYAIVLVESADIPTVGVGEATIPPIESFNKLLGIDPQAFMKATNATFKLGIEFINWGNVGDSYYHPFGTYGTDLHNLPFYQYWQRARQAGAAMRLEDYSVTAQMAMQKRFTPAQKISHSPLEKIQHAYHFDAALYAKYLRKIAESQGVVRIEDDVSHVIQHNSTGFIETLKTKKNTDIHADFFIDCTGFSGLLIDKTLKTPYESWSKYLPCDSAKAVPCAKTDGLASHTKAIAHGFGWQWKIPLQHRTGNGLVYSSSFWSDECAEKTLLMNIEGEPLSDVRQLRFTPGKRTKAWNKNCLSLGLSSGFLEPLESTSIHLIQSALSKFISLFPNFDDFSYEQRQFNKLVDNQMESIRDFIILHYKATQREDTAFWRYCKNMDIPNSLQEKIDLYKNTGHLMREGDDLFSENSWLSVLEGQGQVCQKYNPLTHTAPINDLSAQLQGIRTVVKQCALQAPTHQEFIDKYCKA
ncbi:tryptophan halogenase family protein [Marinagarivorans algicola]|uniref:tryptophan halogenase family protein n=1 Tax=Marinagarivorans algicola TaxID=1513270 RepID=UPI0037355742